VHDVFVPHPGHPRSSSEERLGYSLKNLTPAEHSRECRHPSAPRRHLLHHLLHLAELLQETVHLADRATAPFGHAGAPRAVQQGGILSLGRRHGEDDRFEMLHSFGVDLGLLEHLAVDPGEHLEEPFERSQLFDLLHRGEEVGEVHPLFPHLFFELLGFGFVERRLGFFDEREDVTLLEDPPRHTVGVEVLDRFGLFADADVFDRLACRSIDGERGTAAGVTIHFGEDDAGDVQGVVEPFGDADGVLSGHPVGDEENFGRPQCFLEARQLLHHRFVDLETSRGIDDDDAIAFALGLFDPRLRDADDVGRRAIGIDRNVELFTKRFELIDGGGAVDVGGDKACRAPFLFELERQLRRGRRLSRPLQPDQHHHGGGDGREFEPFAPFAEHGGELFVDDFDELLRGRDRLELRDPDRLRLDPFEEFAREPEAHVGFEEDAADFAEPFFNISFGEHPASAQAGEGVLELIAQFFKHPWKITSAVSAAYDAEARGMRQEGVNADRLAWSTPGQGYYCTFYHMPKPQRKEEILRSELPPTLPLMALRSTIVYPLGTIAVQMGAPENLALLRAHDEPGLVVALVVATGDHEVDVDLHRFVGRIGVAARIHERINLPGDTVQITLQGLRRIVIDDIEQATPYPVAHVKAAKEIAPDPAEVDDLVARVVSASETLAELIERIPDEVPAILKMNISDPGRFADLAATNMNFRIADKDEVLQRLDVGQRLRFLLTRLEREVARARVVEDVKRQTEIKIEQHQREFYLRQQLRAIQAELGEADPSEKEAVQLLRRIEEANLPEKALAEAKRENERLRMLSSASSEYQVIRTYLDWILSLPWHACTGSDSEQISLKTVEDALDARHYGLMDAKERIIEYLAVRKLKGGEQHGPILCFVGPPGTGKTSLGEAIATSIGREFYRISVGGVRDEAEIRGHRRTYVGAMPGLLIQALRRVGVRDPVLMIDEIDKMTSGGPSGDPTAAMLEVLDPAQNKTFVDHYLNLPFDLSSVLFICTANNLFDIPAPLRDRMEIIKVSGYTVEEKVEIAWRYLLPRLLDEHGISDKDIQFTDETLGFIANRYSREAGLRNFERNLAAIMRKRARRKAEDEEGAWVIDTTRVTDILGVPRYAIEEAEMEPEIGAVTGLAWTATGGDLMQIEALRMAGTGRLIVTGQLGDVMRESVDAAYSYVRARANSLGINNDEFKDADVHIHFPAGAIPKDGPSAGAAVTLAIASVLSRRPVRRDLALTGEVTLRGKVLEIGGVKEKVLAAYRAGLREVLMPKANEKDLRDIPDEVRQSMTFTFVGSMDEVLHIALLPKAEPILVDVVTEPDAPQSSDGQADAVATSTAVNAAHAAHAEETGAVV